MKSINDKINESFFDNVGTGLNPTVKMKYEAIINGKLGDSRVYKCKKGGHILCHDHNLYIIEDFIKCFSDAASKNNITSLSFCPDGILIEGEEGYWDVFNKFSRYSGNEKEFMADMKRLETLFTTGK